MQYDVTIGIPVYRAVDYIEKTMASALAQSYPSIEFLVLDDFGNDGSMEVVERLRKEHPRGNEIRIIRHNKNSGIGIARNKILDEAKGKYLFFLDSDDLLKTDTIQLLMNEVQKIDADVVYGSWERIDNINNTPAVQSVYPYIQFTKAGELAMYAFKNYSSFRISICNCLMKTSFLREAKLHFLDTLFWEDMAFTYEMVTKVKRAALIPDITYYYICRPNSLSHFLERKILLKEEILKNASVVSYLKYKFEISRHHNYASYLNYNLGMTSFYIVCYVIKHRKIISPEISAKELKQFMYLPLTLPDILVCKGRFWGNIVLWVLSHMPDFLFKYVVYIAGKFKNVI